MGKIEGMLKSEMSRLAKKEIRKITIPLSRELRSMKKVVSELRKMISSAEKAAFRKERAPAGAIDLQTTPEEAKTARLSPRLIRSLRAKLGITQKELATIAGVTVGAVHQWESGKFRPKDEKKALFVALRKLRRRDVKKLLEARKEDRAETGAVARAPEKPAGAAANRKARPRKRISPKKSRVPTGERPKSAS